MKQGLIKHFFNRLNKIWTIIRHGSVASRFVSDVFINGVAQFVSQIRGLIVLTIIARGLHVSDYGIWSQTTATSLLLLPFLILGLDQAAVRYLPGKFDDKKEFAESFYNMLVVIFFVCFVFVLCAIPFRAGISSMIYGADDQVSFVFLMFLLVMGQVCFRYLLNFWRVTGRIVRHAKIKISMDILLMVGLAVIIFWLKLGIMTGITYWVGLNWVMAMGLFIIILREVPFCRSFNFAVIVPFIKYSSPLVIYAVVNWIIKSSSRYFVVNNFDLAQVGIFSAALTLSTIATSAKMPLNFILLPTLSKMWTKGEKKDVKKYTEASICGYLVLAVPLVVFIGAGAPVFLKLFTGVVVPEGRLIMSLIAVGYLFTGLDQFFRNILMLQEHTFRLVISLLPAAVLNLILNYFLIPAYGLIGAACSVVISLMFKSLILYLQAVREFKFQVDGVFFIKVIIASIAMILVAYGFDPDTIGMLIAGVCLGLVLYIIALFLLGVVKMGDVSNFLNTFNKNSEQI